jgi:hypothetical protein
MGQVRALEERTRSARGSSSSAACRSILMNYVIDRANDVQQRLKILNDAFFILDAFCSLLKDINSRSPTLPRAQARSVATVRASILRSAIALVVAALDRTDRRRGNRASLGHILGLLKDHAVADYLSKPHPTSIKKPIWQEVIDTQSRYDQVLKGPTYDQVRSLRNDAIGHLLLHEDPTSPGEYQEVFALVNELEVMLATLFKGLGIAPPKFIALKKTNTEQAKLFWDTYLAGVAVLS